MRGSNRNCLARSRRSQTRASATNRISRKARHTCRTVRSFESPVQNWQLKIDTERSLERERRILSVALRFLALMRPLSSTVTIQIIESQPQGGKWCEVLA